MKKGSDRVIFDTNIWISYLLTKNYSELDEKISSGKIQLVFSAELLDEFVEVSQRPKFKKYFSQNNVEKLLFMIEANAIFVDVTSEIKKSRDHKDNFLLSLAHDSKATHLITGDNDLLILKKIGKTKILTITDYLSNS